MSDELLTPKQVSAEYPALCLPQALADWRWRGVGPDYIKTGTGKSGRIFYRRSAIERWLDECTVTPAKTSEVLRGLVE